MCELKCYCLLDLADLDSKFLRTNEASAVLGRLRELDTESGKHLRKQNVKGLELAVRQKLGILKSVADSRLHIARAETSRSFSAKKTHIRTAIEVITRAKRAIELWFPNEHEWLSEQEEGRASVLSKLGNMETFNQALHIYNALLEKLQSDYSSPSRPLSETRVWTLKCRFAHAKI
jgi:hypothetical protein